MSPWKAAIVAFFVVGFPIYLTGWPGAGLVGLGAGIVAYWATKLRHAQ